jgi:hypothetical protein
MEKSRIHGIIPSILNDTVYILSKLLKSRIHGIIPSILNDTQRNEPTILEKVNETVNKIISGGSWF